MSSVASTNQEALFVIDGVPLKERLRLAERKKRITAFLLVLPLLAFIIITFAVPIGDMLFRSVDNPRIQRLMPETVALLQAWDISSSELPDEAVFESLTKELVALRKAGDIGKVASRMNFDLRGARSLIVKSGRKLMRVKEGPYKAAVIKADKRWKKRITWTTMKASSMPLTPSFFMRAFDYGFDEDLNVTRLPEERQIYLTLFIRTLWISALVTLTCLALGYPIAYLLATLPAKTSNLLIILVLLPFWTSLLVRTTSWIVLLQTQGVLNDLMVWVGIISDENRLQMIYNQTGTLIAMSQILLPFMVLPLYSVMKTIPISQVRASQSLGANPFTSFMRIFLPQSVPGMGAGGLLVFVLSVGYYITPALVGGSSGQLISNQIAFHMKSSLNWGLAAALGAILLIVVLVLYWLYDRIVGIERMKLG
jgi:putative spermidine/putrescine transport system permease protein